MDGAERMKEFNGNSESSEHIRCRKCRGVGLSAAEHQDVVRAANQADASLLSSMGLSDSTTANMITARPKSVHEYRGPI